MSTIALGMASSKSEARRLVDQGGVRLNDQPVPAATARMTEADLGNGGTARLSVGQKAPRFDSPRLKQESVRVFHRAATAERPNPATVGFPGPPSQPAAAGNIS